MLLKDDKKAFIWKFLLSNRFGLFLIAIFSVFYYGLYIDSSLNTADDGLYAQISYELLLGTDPHQLNYPYGLMWFKLGQLIFTIAGPDWINIQYIFFGTISITSLLAYATVKRVTDSQFLALSAAGIMVLVPAFPATAFYAFCTLLNVFSQTWLAERWRNIRLRDVALPAATLSLTFQIRADFGFLFAIPLSGLLLANAIFGDQSYLWRSRRPHERLRRLMLLSATALAVIVAVQLPILLRAASRGYADLAVMDVLRYPLTILNYVLTVFGPAPSAATGVIQDKAAGAAGTLLQRPSLSGFWSNIWSGQPQALMAALVYGPLLVLSLFLIVIVMRLRQPGGADRLPVLLTALAGMFATMPHYFLFRPDLAHIANFMPGFVTLGFVMLAELMVMVQPMARPVIGASPLEKGAAGLAAMSFLVIVGIYMWVGLTTPGTGSIVRSFERYEHFSARNVSDVRLTPIDAQQLRGVRDLIDQVSAPGDRIVCVPYCPGMIFMTGRRMLLRDYFVDDSFLLRDPGWIDRAIATTRQARPPVVIVVDWAIHGTDISRFQNWAHRYIDALVTDGYTRIDLPGIMAYRRPPG